MHKAARRTETRLEFGRADGRIEMVREEAGDLLGMVGLGVQIATRIELDRFRRRCECPFADPAADYRIVETYDVRAGNDRPLGL